MISSNLSSIDYHYPVISGKPNESCLYFIKNKKTGRFYRGHSQNSNVLLRIHKHRSNIRKSQDWELRGVKTSEMVTYEKRISDIKSGVTVYHIFKNLGQKSK